MRDICSNEFYYLEVNIIRLTLGHLPVLLHGINLVRHSEYITCVAIYPGLPVL